MDENIRKQKTPVLYRDFGSSVGEQLAMGLHLKGLCIWYSYIISRTRLFMNDTVLLIFSAGVRFDDVIGTQGPSASVRTSHQSRTDRQIPVFVFRNEKLNGARSTLEFVEEVYLEPDVAARRLLPREPAARAHARRVCDVIDRHVLASFQAFAAAPDDREKKSHFVKVLQGFLLVFADVTQRFICGDVALLPDVLLAPVAHRVIALVPAASRGHLFVPRCEKFRKFWKWWECVQKQDFFSKVRLTDEELRLELK